MKRFLKLFIAVTAFVIMSAFSVLGASEEDGSIEIENVVIEDNAGLLTDDEIEELYNQAKDVGNKYNINIMVVTEDVYISDAQSAAEAKYLEFFPEYTDGIGLYINMNTRDYWFLNSGKIKKDITEDYGLAVIEEDVQPELSDENYKEAFEIFIELTGKFEKAAAKGRPYGPLHPYRTVFGYIIRVIISAGIAAIIAFIHIAIEKGKLKTVKSQPYAKEYVSEGGFKVDKKTDTFMYKHTKAVPIPKETSSSSGGSHTSSGSSSFGGRGGKF